MLAAALLAALLAQDKEETHVAKKAALTPVFELDAAFESAETFELRLRFESGSVDAALLKAAAHGAPAKKGEVLLELDGGPLRKQVAAAENELRGARAALEKSRSDRELGARADALALGQAEHAARHAEAELQDFDEVEGKHMLLSAELNAKQMENFLADQKEELEQLEKMYKSEELTNATAEIVVRRARRSVELLKIIVKASRESADSVVKLKQPAARRRHADQVENARAALAQLKAQQALSAVQRDVELAKAEASVRQQEEQLARLRKDVDALLVRAPFDGRVFWGQFQNGQWPPLEQAGQALRPGEKPQPGAVLLTLCGDALRVRADLPEADYFGLEPGAPALVVPLAAPQRSAAGKLASKSFFALPRAAGPAFDARVELDAPPAGLLHGMKAKATLRGAELKDVLLVPLAAVKKDGEKRTVKVRGVEREVKTGFHDGQMIHVREGLQEGEAVALPKG